MHCLRFAQHDMSTGLNMTPTKSSVLFEVRARHALPLPLGGTSTPGSLLVA